MTTLLIQVVQGPSRLINKTRQVSSGEFAIGRDIANDWVLDDPERLVSGRHCVFRQDDAGWSVVDCSRNGTRLANADGRASIGSQPRRLAAGDRLQIGNYELAVDLQEDEASFRIIPLAQVVGRIGPRQPVRPLRTIASPRLAPGLAPGVAPGLETVAAVPEQGETIRMQAGVGRPAAGLPSDLSAEMLAGLVRNLRRFGAPLGGPLLQAASDRDAIAWLTGQGAGAPAVIEAAFADLRLHQACVLQAGRVCAHEILAGLDPDESDRRLMPSWMDLLPGWRRARALALSRRRYRRIRAQIERILDRGFERAYARAWQDAVRYRDSR